MDRRSFDIMMKKLGRSKSSSATLELPPIINASRAISSCSLYRKSRARVVQSIRKRVEKITPVTLPTRVTPIPGRSEVDMAKFAKQSKVTEMSRFLEKDIRKRIKARSLESKYTKFLDLIMSEVREDYLTINRYISVKTKTKLPPNEQLDIKILPYKYLGKTERYPEYLKVRKVVKKKWILHYGLLRNILKNCVTKLPYVLIKLPSQQPCPFKLEEFEDKIHKEIRDASLFLRDFYRTIVQLIEEDDVSVHKNNLHRYYGACTGLFTLHLSKSIAHTILYIVDFTSCDKLVPYLLLSVSFDNTAILCPTCEEITDMYTNFITALLDVGNQFYVLQRVKLTGYSSKRITLYITEDFINDCKNKIKRNIAEAFKQVTDYVDSLNSEFQEIYEDVSCAENKFFSDIIFADGYEKIIHYKQFRLRVFNIPSRQYFQIGYVMMKRYTTSITSGLKLLIENIFQKLALQHLYEVNDINDIFSMISYRAHKNPKTTEELIEIIKYMAWVKEEFLEQLTDRVYTALNDMVKLITLGPLTENHMQLNCSIKGWLDKIQPILDQNYQTFDQLKFEAEENLQRVIEEVNDDVKNVYPLLDILNDMDDISLVKSYLSHIISHVMMIKDIEAKISWINQEEMCLSFPKSTYKEYESLKNYVYPFYHLLKLCLNVKRSLYVWENGQFEILCHDATIRQLREYETELQNIQKTYRNKFRKSQEDTSEIKFKGTVDDPDILNWPAPLKLCHTALQAIDKFKPSLEIMKIMCNPTLKKRHWLEMSKIAGFNVQPDAGTTLRKLMDIDYGPELTKYETISTYATKEAELLRQLDNMKTDWAHVEFSLEFDKNVQYNKLVDFSKIEDTINDHMIHVSNMEKSVYVTPHKTKVEDFGSKLQTISRTIVECILVQDRWLQLAPIFLEEQIASEIPSCANLFSQADSLYKTSITKIETSANVMTNAGNTEFFTVLLNCTQILEEVYCILCRYIESKRLYFPRLYFLTDDELITLISKSNDLLQVQPYISNLFPSIARIIFKESDISGFVSFEGEQIVFDTVDIRSDKGLVEKWLKIFENKMVNMISNLIRKSFENYYVEDWKTWIQHWPGHVTAIVMKLIWTSKIQAGIGKETIRQLFLEAENDVSKISEIMKSEDQTILMRAKLKTLIITSIHTMNVIHEFIKQEVKDQSNFLWIGQLRYYQNEEHCEVKLLNASFVYGNEYVDNSGRLIMTPLTERCYRTVFSAFHMHLYASPLGPAGTGKTETVKDLAKSLGVLCIVFSCSNSLDYSTVARFIKGTAASGAWLALDEFNRITTEILSAIYQTIYSLQLAIKSKMKSLTIDKTQLILNRNCFICTTMNPGYPGRSDLPENLKSLFRNVAMMVPDSLKISEVSLISFGYAKAKEMSLKLVATFKLMAETFSSEKHYDFGIRTLKAVLSKCDEFKGTHADSDEARMVSKAVREIISPRIVFADGILFEEILLDMFAVDTSVASSDVLSKELVSICCTNSGIHFNDALFGKLQQFYSTLSTRKGVIIVGEVASGKSTVIKTLAKILTDADNDIFVSCNIINPKTMTLEQLYGQYDVTLQLWRDGVLTKCIRKGLNITQDTRQWIVFDGPIDTVWVENLNSVLDDNQKLCLCSGETVDVNDYISLIFETTDLKGASPATVSRCGITYTETDAHSWQWILETWLAHCEHTWCSQNSTYIRPLFSWLIPACLGTVGSLTHCFKMTATNLVLTFLRLFESFVCDAIQINNSKDDEYKNIRSWIQASTIQACFWAFSCTLNQDSMSKFDELFRTIWKGQNSTYPFLENMDKMEVGMPQDTTVYESSYIYKQKGAWKNWSDLIKTEKISESILSQEILVPTVNLAKYTLLLDFHVRSKIPILFIGPSGCGKTSTIQEFLINKLNTIKYEASSLSLTFNMAPSDVQNKILAKLRKGKAGLYGPSAGKSFVLFIDDLNVTEADEYGTQTVLELLRQHLDHNVWYDLRSLTALELADITFLTAFTLKRFSESDCTRLLRHFSIFAVNEFTHDMRFKIYSSLLQYQWRKSGFPADVVATVNQIVNATSQFYDKIVENLKQTIDTPLYNFNMFDFSKAIKGFVLLKKETADTDKKIFPKLWVYEMLRIFGDRITASKDREWFADNISPVVQHHFNEDVAHILSNAVPTNEEAEEDVQTATFESISKIMFHLKVNDGKETQVLEEISLTSFEEMLTSLLVQYNENHDNKLNIVIFEHFIMNVMKIAHKLASLKTNAMVIGMSSVGRKTACVVACELMKHKLHEPIMMEKFSREEWRKQVKEALIDSGARMERCMLLVDAFRIEDMFFLNDIDYILKANDVETIFDSVEQQNLLHLTRSYLLSEKINLDMSASSVFLYFNKRCKENLHVLACLSSFNTRIQKIFQNYPSFSKYCDKIMFEDWPPEGFHAVAKSWLHEVKLDERIKLKINNEIQIFHKYTLSISKKFHEEHGIKNFVTNVALLEVIKMYAKVITEKQNDLSTLKSRYSIGLDKLSFAAVQIKKMQQALANYQPKLREMTERAKKMMEQIALETVEVEKVKDLVKIDEEVANEQAIAANILTADCEAELAQAIPILEDAISALNTLKPTDITLVKSMKNPPDAIKLVMAAVCVIKDVKPDRIPDPSTGRKTLDYWGPSKRILGDMNFLQSLKDFDKNNIKPELMVKIRKEYLPHKDFQPHVVAKASSAAEGLCKWIIAMDMYDKVAKEVAPKKEKLEKAEAEYAQTLAILNEKKAEVARLQGKLAELNSTLKEAEKQQQILQNEVDLCNKRLKRAQKLISGLGGEKERWTNVSDTLQEHFDNLAGDILISCAIIAYLAPFSREVREEAISSWKMSVREAEIPTSSDFYFTQVLGSESAVQKWHINNLPQDKFFVEDAIIHQYCYRWPLFLDPQFLARQWIKATEKRNNLRIVTISDTNMLQTVKTSIQLGSPVIIEGVKEELDPCLEQVLFTNTAREHSIQPIDSSQCSKGFRLYFLSHTKKPQYSPEVFCRVHVINFSLTKNSLAGILLNSVTEIENPKIKLREKLLNIEMMENGKHLKVTEEKILQTLSDSKADILEDEIALKILDESKNFSNEIREKQDCVKEKIMEILEIKKYYTKLAGHISVVFEAISELHKINYMYQYSLSWFLNILIDSIRTAEVSNIIEKRSKILKQKITYDVFTFVTRSLHVKDRMGFAFLLCIKLNVYYKLVTLSELNFFLDECRVNNHTNENKSSAKHSMRKIMQLAEIDPIFEEFSQSIIKDFIPFQTFVNDKNFPDCELPFEWYRVLSPFKKFLIMTTLRPDKIFDVIFQYVGDQFGKKYIEPIHFDLSISYNQSNALCPLIFLLSRDTSDPMTLLLKFAKLKNMSHKLHTVSLGTGQGSKAKKIVLKGRKGGYWVCLQNCHLSTDWMSELKITFDDYNYDNTHENFRLWLTTCESKDFPVFFLQNGIKMVNEAPPGVRENILRTYTRHPVNDAAFYAGCPGKDDTFHRLLFSIAIFRAVIEERKDFGPIGWNIPYQFRHTDFHLAVKHLQKFLIQHEDPFEALQYLIGECDYGGRVSDDWDQRLINALLKDYLNADVAKTNSYVFYENYLLPKKNDYSDYLSQILKMPSKDHPELFGLHQNMEEIKLSNKSGIIMETLRRFVSHSVDYKTSTCHTIQPIIASIKSLLPDFECQKSESVSPTKFSSILSREVQFYELLYYKIVGYLDRITNFINGESPSSLEIDEIISSLILYEVPKTWAKISYPTVNSLSGYIEDLSNRLTYISEWSKELSYNNIWFPVLTFPNSYLATLKKHFSTNKSIPLEYVKLSVHIGEVPSCPDVATIYGLYIEGACWNHEKMCLDELPPGIVCAKMPSIVLDGTHSRHLVVENMCKVPVYRIWTRRGVISTSGHSTNYIFPILLNTDRQVDHWTKRGVALLCQIRT